VAPDIFAGRLEAAGFEDVVIECGRGRFGFLANRN
jgi:hypothetical protein